MIKTIIFDFDGVIVESIDIKTEAFREMFKEYPKEQRDAFLDYHINNGGISRQRKITYFYQNILKQPLSPQKLDELCDQFHHLVMERVIASPFVAGAKELLDKGKGRYRMYVVSGTPQEEMRVIVFRRGLKDYFVDVFGSPDTKGDVAKRILKQEQCLPRESVFIGDSINDLAAAKEAGVPFVGRAHVPDEGWLKDKYIFTVVKDLTGLQNIIEELGKGSKVL